MSKDNENNKGVVTEVVTDVVTQEVKYHKLNINASTTESVVIYQNRAEVTRIYEIDQQLCGENCFTFSNLCPYADTDSMRVEGLGQGQINEVNCERIYHDMGVDLEQKDEIENINNEIYEANLRLTMLKSLAGSNKHMETFLNGTLTKYSSKSEKKEILSREVVEGMTELVSFYDRQSKDVFHTSNEITSEIKKINEIKNILREKLNKFQDTGDRFKTVLTVLVDLGKAARTDVTLLRISYIVTNAGWTPRYDIRITNGKMKLSYDADVYQTTGENWTNIKLKLSTATPSLGAKVPKLSTKYLEIKRKQPVFAKNMRMAGMFKGQIQSQDCRNFGGGSEMSAEEPLMCAMQVEVAKVESNSVNETFVIQRRYTIDSLSGKTHKVVISILDLTPSLVYAAVPRLSTMAYLQAKVTNTSEYTLLPGPCNIFMDNNFLAKNQLEMVSPGEEFKCDLGTDDAIKIIHIPSVKFKEELGYISKSTQLSYIDQIEITNTHKETIEINIIEQLPKSKDEKIKVKVIEPNLKNGENVKLNKDNNVEWDIKIDSHKKIKLVLRYSIEHPNNEEISEY